MKRYQIEKVMFNYEYDFARIGERFTKYKKSFFSQIGERSYETEKILPDSGERSRNGEGSTGFQRNL